MKTMHPQEIKKTIKRYSERYERFGCSPKALGWAKGKQDIRFDILLSLCDIENKTLLDIGCGFGDLNAFLGGRAEPYNYIGCDLCEFLIEEARTHHPDCQFISGDFLAIEFDQHMDWVVASGPFNHKLEAMDNYAFIHEVMRKNFTIVQDGFSFDFISDKVDFIDDDLFYASPEKILSFAFGLSRNVVLRSDYMPFEFSLFVFKDDSFDLTDTIFSRYKYARNI